MRLTLRTLLAYMDNILEPKDAEDIGKKVQDSEVATNLLHRIRDVMRRLRLKAPDVEDRSAGLDPNTVAEYLDNTLPDDRVPDFEKVCLESDTHLAEVASCHQILALVLGEPAEIDPASREHMYQLPQVLAEQAAMEARQAAEAAGGDGGPPAVPPLPPRRPKPIVPDYLRERPKRRRRVPVAVVLVGLAFVVCVGVVAALGLAGRLDGLGILAGRQIAQNPFDEAAETALPKETEGAAAPAVPSEPQPTPAKATPEQPAPATAPDAAPRKAAESGAKPPEVKPEPVAGVKPVPAAPGAAVETPSTVPATSGQPVATPPLATPAQPTASPSAPGSPLVQPATPPPPAAVAQPSAQPTAPPTPAEKTATPTAAQPPESIGRFISDQQVLLRMDAESKEWTRVPAQGILAPRSELMSLPAFRPVIALTAGLTIQLTDATRIRIEPNTERGVSSLAMAYGRLIVRTVAKPDTQLALRMGDRNGVVTFVNPVATLAIEVVRTLPPGVDPEKDSPPPSVELYAVAGQILWDEGGVGKPVVLNAPARLTANAQSKPAAITEEQLPRWLVADTAGKMDRDRLALPSLNEGLQTDRPVVLGLREMVDHRKQEVRWLAIRCLGHVGEFGPMLAVLDDRSRKTDWPDYIVELRAAMALGPDVAAQVRLACEKAHGPDGAGLFRMLWGYTDEQLAAGEDAKLVGYLDHEALAFRVVSLWTLKQITGAMLYYQPDATPVKRQQPIRKWKQRQEKGEIRWKPITERRPEPPEAPAETPTPKAGGE